MTDTHATSDFFDLIHPAEGWRCLFTLPDRKHHWFQDSASLAAAALRLDAEGKAVFHSCATFTEKKRKQEHVAGIKCLWLDIDAGVGKPYSDAQDAYRALEEWRQAVVLPKCLLVVSGGGLHAYWPLRHSLGGGPWIAAANQLRSLAVEHGLHIDPGSTIDSARILRPPGTHNRKLFDAEGKKVADIGGPSRPVRAGPLVGPYDVADLQPLFGREVVQHPSAQAESRQNNATPLGSFGLGAVPAHLKTAPIIEGLAQGFIDERPSDPALIVQRCAQMRVPAGRDPDSGWYAITGVLAFCGTAGREYARSLATHPEWVPVIDEKLDRWLAKTSGPTTCKRFAELNPTGCAGCAYRGKVASPLHLGRDGIPAAVTASAPPGVALPILPFPFLWRGTSLAIQRKPTEADPKDHHVIADYPVCVTELQEAERSGGISAVFRSWEPSKHDWREFVLQLKDIIGDRGNSAMANHGVAIRKSRWDSMRDYVVAMTNHYRGTQAYGTRYEQFGWKDSRAFVVGQDLLRAGAETAHVFGNAEVTRRGAMLEAHGTVGAWSAAAHAAVARPGMEAHAFVAVCAFASVLHQFTRAPGGTVVHAAHMSSGKGKTFALDMAASVWGETTALRLKERDTAVAKFIAIGTLCHLPVVYDELRVRGPDGPDIVKEFILHYTLGEDKARGAADGGLRSDALPWSNLLLSAANISLIDTCLSDGSETAQAARVFEFVPTLPEGVKTTEGDALMRAMQDNRGTAGRAFVAAVLANIDWVKKAVPEAMAMWERRLRAGPESRYLLRLLATVTVAATLLSQHGILKLDIPAVLKWAEGVARENVQRVSTDTKLDVGTIVGRLINDLVPATLVMPNTPGRGNPGARFEAVREPRNELAARYSTDSCEFLVDIVVVRRWMQKHNYPYTQLGAQLEQEKILTDGRARRTLGAGWRRSGGQVWCWAIDGKHPAVAEILTDIATPDQQAGVVVPLRGRA